MLGPRTAAAPPAAAPASWARRGANGRSMPGRRTAAAPPAAAGGTRWDEPGWRRALQLALAALWLLDAVLQYQTFMFSQGFPRMLAATAAGNPGPVAGPVAWSAHLIGTHPGAATAALGTLQLLLALGIAWRPTVRAALAASIAWAVAVWWLGEGLGGVLTGAASPVTGAPGAALLYALAAVLLWPARHAGRRTGGRDRANGRHRPAPFVAAAAVGAPTARALWFVLWGGLAWLALLAARGPGLLPGEEPAPGGMASGDPGWLRSLGAAASGLAGRHAAAATVVTVALLAVIAVGVYLPVPAARAALCLAVLAAVAVWAAGQDLGGLFTRATTDPDTAPLLVLLAAAYWPIPEPLPVRGSGRAAGGMPTVPRSHGHWRGWADGTAAPGDRTTASDRRVPRGRADRAADPGRPTGARRGVPRSHRRGMSRLAQP